MQVAPDGAVTVFTGKAELGQGIRTALLQVAAEQLYLRPGQVTLVTADTGRTANEGYTAGSHSMQDSGTAIMNAAAEVRAILVAAGGERLGRAGGAVHRRRPDRRAGRAQPRLWRAGRRLAPDRLATPDAPLKDPAAYSVIGQPVPRVDIPAKVTGGAAYVQDMRLPGMLHARVVRPPRYGAVLARLDDAPVAAMPGVVKVVRDGNYLGVLARASGRRSPPCARSPHAAEWSRRPRLPEQATIFDTIQALPSQDDRDPGPQGRRRAASRSARGALPAPVRHARLDRPVLRGGAAAGRHDDGVDAHPGRVSRPCARWPSCCDAAGAVRCIHTEGSGCYGHNGADDAAADAALLARAVPGRPVRVQWMREQENIWEPYTPAMVTEVQASLDADGTIVDWQYGVWSNTHNMRPGNAGRLMPSWALAHAVAALAADADPAARGRRRPQRHPAVRPAAARVVSHFLPDMPLRVSAMRGLGAYANVFSIESFMDELAAAAGADPVAFRLAHLKDPRARDVVDAGRAEFGWDAAASCRRGTAAASPSRATRTSAPIARSRWRWRSSTRPAGCAWCGRIARWTAARPSARTASATRSQAAWCSRPAGRCYEAVGFEPAASPAGTGAATRSCASPRCRTASTCTSSTGPAAVPRHRRGGAGAHRGRDRQRGGRCGQGAASANCRCRRTRVKAAIGV